MIRRISVKRFKKFDKLECELQERTVIAGPNNSGKTTLLQAIATWSELGELWLENNADLVRDQKDGTYRRIEVDLAAFGTLALSSFDELWHNQETREAMSLRVIGDRWDVGFDLQFRDPSTVTVGPLTEVSEDDLEAYAERPCKALYIPSLSGLDVNEPEYGERVLATRLAHGKGGTVVRNMIQATSQDRDKWKSLQKTVNDFFGYELDIPSGADPIKARYRHSTEGGWYDLVNGASGFLQTVLLKSALLYSNAAVFLIDEPDAHLHTLLKEKIYKLLRDYSEERRCQTVMATHSGRLIEEAGRESDQRLFVVTSQGLNPVRQQEARALLTISTEQIVHAETFRRVLYLEGKSDLDTLREWAGVLGHPAEEFLRGVFWVATAEEKGRNYAQKHFRTLRAQVPDLLGLEIRDRNGKELGLDGEPELGTLLIEEGGRKTPNGMKRVFWNRYETENYLVHPAAIVRLVAQLMDDEAVAAVEEHMRQFLPPVLFDRPFERTAGDRDKGKTRIREILTAAGVDLVESEYYRIARVMTREEIHPDVEAMLDAIGDRLMSEGVAAGEE